MLFMFKRFFLLHRRTPTRVRRDPEPLPRIRYP
jgi:hypothetical protein